jgi:hypothetical protein
MYYLKACCLFILWKHYGSLRHIYISYETSKIKHIYDSLDTILPNIYNSQCLDTIKDGRSAFFTSLLSATSTTFNEKVEKALMLVHCRADVSFLGGALFGYLNGYRGDAYPDLSKNKIYNLMLGGSYIGNLSETVHLEVATGMNTLLLNIRNRKNEIDHLVRQIQLESNHIVSLVVSYLYFCLWSFQFIFFFFNFSSMKGRIGDAATSRVER